MPVIDSKKYSCEPCIRGHRATKCTHTNRLLVLVRKPGRPMQNCAHELEGCVCGRLGAAGEDWGVDNMSKPDGFDARKSFNVIGTRGSEESQKHVSRTESRKRKRKAKKDGISDVQKNKVNKRVTSLSRKILSPSPKCPVSDQQEVPEYSSNAEPEILLDPTHSKLFISSSISIPAISNFLPPITTLIPQAQDYNLAAPQASYIDHSPSCILYHQQQNGQASLGPSFPTPFLRYTE
ncbi:uncharacterized protein EAE97_009891 [Botrytis byssoidea]|uniref:Copper-fist domain-containing protein n=1 Tax=Botrytis byssoidea TaxID=139641 RepID=A0A9P5I2I7_9HELO|nr:uncharacterized protein EAE97_009891 [Botrytis byssoidea]KAF7928093.1 hypothetical protein EAE97_009891 [Botrytis byssoidea]